MQEILVAVDGSKQSEKVVDYSSELANKLDSKIVLLYVVGGLDVPEGYMEYARIEKIPDPVSSYLASVGEEVIKNLGDRLKKKGAKFEGLVETGTPAVKITEVARDRKVALVVVGLKGLHGVARLRALGSVSRRVVENSPCPVIVVPS